jgi:hypothetical protein
VPRRLRIRRLDHAKQARAVACGSLREGPRHRRLAEGDLESDEQDASGAAGGDESWTTGLVCGERLGDEVLEEGFETVFNRSGVLADVFREGTPCGAGL